MDTKTLITKVTELLDEAERMRGNQICFFAEKDNRKLKSEYLRDSKIHEKAFDKKVRELRELMKDAPKTEQPNLFS